MLSRRGKVLSLDKQQWFRTWFWSFSASNSTYPLGVFSGFGVLGQVGRFAFARVMVNAMFVCGIPPSVESGVFPGLKESVKSLTSDVYVTVRFFSERLGSFVNTFKHRLNS